MPFTVSHVAAVLPLRKTRLIWSALIVGAMAPDFEYLLRLSVEDRYSHTLKGMFEVTLPLALIGLWLFQRFVKDTFLELMPESIRTRAAGSTAKFRFGGAARFTLILISILVGASTHLIWDSLTHSSPLTRESSLLQHSVFAWRGRDVPFYEILQLASSALGLTILAVWLIWWYHSESPQCDPPEKTNSCNVVGNDWSARQILTLVVIAIIALAAGLVRALARTEIAPGRLQLFAGLLVTTAMATAWWEFVLLGIWRDKHSRGE
jgi:Domain of unknown function (DUF4184)